MSLKERTKLTRLDGVFNHTGLDGAGKGTQIALLQDRLSEQGVAAVVTKAYSDEEKKRWSPLISKLLRGGMLGDMSVTLLFQQFHRRQVRQTVAEREKGNVVLADRWDEGFLAYHRHNGLLAKQPRLRALLLGHGFQGYIPEETIFYDIHPLVAKQRMIFRGELDAFDAKSLNHHAAMRAHYHSLAEERNWKTIDADQPPEFISEQVWQLLVPLIFTA